jgi:hypothetical protein
MKARPLLETALEEEESHIRLSLLRDSQALVCGCWLTSGEEWHFFESAGLTALHLSLGWGVKWKNFTLELSLKAVGLHLGGGKRRRGARHGGSRL